MGLVEPLDPIALCRRCDPSQFAFETTAELEDLTGILGQERAVEAVRFGINIQREGYNLFALGPEGTGKNSVVRRFLQDKAAGQAVPADWCYIQNFADPYKPRALRLPPGGGNKRRLLRLRIIVRGARRSKRNFGSGKSRP
jgi:hypothetical protein